MLYACDAGHAHDVYNTPVIDNIVVELLFSQYHIAGLLTNEDTRSSAVVDANERVERVSQISPNGRNSHVLDGQKSGLFPATRKEAAAACMCTS